MNSVRATLKRNVSFTVSSRTIPNWLLTAFVLRPNWMRTSKDGLLKCDVVKDAYFPPLLFAPENAHLHPRSPGLQIYSSHHRCRGSSWSQKAGGVRRMELVSGLQGGAWRPDVGSGVARAVCEPLYPPHAFFSGHLRRNQINLCQYTY